MGFARNIQLRGTTCLVYSLLSTIMKHLRLSGCPVEWPWWGMVPWDVQWHCPRIFCPIPLCIPLDSWCVVIYTCIWPYLLKFVVLSLGAMRRVLMVLLPLKCIWISKVVACPFKPLPKFVDVWYHYGDVSGIWSIVVVVYIASGCLSIVGVVFMVEFLL